MQGKQKEDPGMLRKLMLPLLVSGGVGVVAALAGGLPPGANLPATPMPPGNY